MNVTLPSGKVIKNIPEGTPKEEIRRKAISAGLATEDDFSPQKRQPQESTTRSQQQAQTAEGAVGQAVFDAASGISEMFTGEERTGRDIERLPGLFQSGIVQDMPGADRAKLVAAAQMTSDPNELAQIVKEQVPGVEVVFNRDEQGNVYPVIADQQGRAAMVDKPGLDLLNVAQMAADVAAFTPAARAGGLIKGAAMATGTEAVRQAGQAAAGGEFDPEQVALAGGLEGAGRVAERGIGAAYRGVAGRQTDEVSEILEAGEKYDVPVMTTDIAEPRTPAGRAGQVMAETVPIAGTGGKRAAQQEARERAVDEFVDRFQGGSYENIVQSLKAQRDKIKSAAGKTYERLVPKLDEASEQAGGISFTNAQQAIEEASDVLTQPGRKTSGRAVDLLSDIQETITGPGQTFRNVKTNIGAWQEALDSVDPNIRSQLTSEDKKVLTNVLRSLRKDRDEFARQSLSPNEFRQLKRADEVYGEMANKLKNTRLKNVLDRGDATPEYARNLLFSNKPSEVRTLYEGLTDEGRANARATIISDIADRLSSRASGLTPDALATELGKRKEVLDTFFRGNRRKELRGFLRLLDSTRRAQRSEGTFTAATGQQAIPYIVGAGSVMEPGIAGAYGGIGALGRLYESPRVRGILARMSSIEPGSTQFEELAGRFREEASRVAQSLKEEQEESDGVTAGNE